MNDTETPETPTNTNIPQFDSIPPQPDPIPAGFRRLFGFVRHTIEIAILGVFLLAICGTVPDKLPGLLEDAFFNIFHAADSVRENWVDRYAGMFVALPALALAQPSQFAG